MWVFINSAMLKNKWVVDYVIENYQTCSDREIAKACGVNYVTIFNIRKKHELERSPEFNRERRILSGKLGGTETNKVDRSGENNANWKGGISKDYSRYTLKSIAKFREKHLARKRTRYAIKVGMLKKESCILCGDPKTEAHHEDYSKPLEVIWFCKPHHLKYHRNQLSKSDKDFLTERVKQCGALLINI